MDGWPRCVATRHRVVRQPRGALLDRRTRVRPGLEHAAEGLYASTYLEWIEAGCLWDGCKSALPINMSGVDRSGVPAKCRDGFQFLVHDPHEFSRGLCFDVFWTWLYRKISSWVSAARSHEPISCTLFKKVLRLNRFTLHRQGSSRTIFHSTSRSSLRVFACSGMALRHNLSKTPLQLVRESLGHFFGDKLALVKFTGIWHLAPKACLLVCGNCIIPAVSCESTVVFMLLQRAAALPIVASESFFCSCRSKKGKGAAVGGVHLQ
jgi:hypothetical protein